MLFKEIFFSRLKKSSSFFKLKKKLIENRSKLIELTRFLGFKIKNHKLILSFYIIHH